MPNATSLCAAQNGTGITPFANTPDGYHLQAGDRLSGLEYYTYGAASYVLNNNGAAVAEVDNQFEELVSTPTYWTLYATNSYVFGPSYEATYNAYCGVNIHGASDPTCSTWSGNSGATGNLSGTISALGTGSHTLKIKMYFGSKHAVKFPMLNDKLLWPSLQKAENIDDYGHWGSHWRGWDTCQSSSVSLCADTDNGS